MKIHEFMKKPTNFMVYCGSPGIGKTYLCSALVEWAMQNYDYDWRYFTENKLLKIIRDSMDTLKGDYLDVLMSKIDSEFLIIDDVGSSIKVNEWREEIFFNLIDYRYNSMKPTLITSNFSQKDFLNIYHKRVHSRLFAKENIIIEIPEGYDYRIEDMNSQCPPFNQK